jgi:hypothetical protein
MCALPLAVPAEGAPTAETLVLGLRSQFPQAVNKVSSGHIVFPPETGTDLHGGLLTERREFGQA